MAHRTSAAALRAARVVLQHYDLEPKPADQVPNSVPGLNGDDAHVAVVIDYATRIFEIAGLRPELRYWQERLHAGTATAPQIAAFFAHVLEAFTCIPQETEENKITAVMEGPKEWRGATRVMQISKLAREASRFLHYYYHVVPKRAIAVADENLERVRVAKLVDAGLMWVKAARALPILQDCQEALRLGMATSVDVVECLRKVGIYLTYLPAYEDMEEETKLLV